MAVGTQKPIGTGGEESLVVIKKIPVAVTEAVGSRSSTVNAVDLDVKIVVSILVVRVGILVVDEKVGH